MVSSALMAFLHFVAAFGMVGVLVVEWLTMNPSLSYAEARRLQRCDLWYGLFAGLVLIVGFLRVFYFEKGAAFYMANLFFHAKIGLFVASGLLSIYPTVRFLSWRRHTRAGEAPVVSAKEYRRLNTVLRIEMVLLVALILCASLMAKGVGF